MVEAMAGGEVTATAAAATMVESAVAVPKAESEGEVATARR